MNKKYIIIILILSVLGISSYFIFKNKKENTEVSTELTDKEKEEILNNLYKKPEIIKNSKNKPPLFNDQIEKQNIVFDNKFNINLNSLIYKNGGESFKNYLEKVGNFEIDQKAPNSKIVKDVSLKQFDLNNYFMSLASFTESYSKRAYPDNMGVATGFGYNISMQTKKLNKEIFESIDMQKASIISQSITGQMSFSSLSNDQINTVSLSPQRAVQVTEIMKKEFESHIPSIIGNAALNNSKAVSYMKEKNMNSDEFGKYVLDSLKPNEKDVIVYNVYKVGPGGFAKYKKLLNSLIEYHFDRKQENSDKVASSFTYKYSIDGVVKQDTRSSALITTMWTSPDDFKEVVSKAGIYPDRVLKRVQSIHKDNTLFNNDNSPNDDFGNLRRSGKSIKFMGEFTVKEYKRSMGAFMGA